MNGGEPRTHGTAHTTATPPEAPDATTIGADGLFFGILLGGALYVLVRYVLFGFFTVDQNERAVKTSFGRAQRIAGTTLDTAVAQGLTAEEIARLFPSGLTAKGVESALRRVVKWLRGEVERRNEQDRVNPG